VRRRTAGGQVDELILETTVLIDLEREAADAPGPAHRFLDEHPEARLSITWVTAGEIACGPGMDGREGWRRLIRRFRRIDPDEEVAWRYGQTYRYLRENGLLIGSNDLWIAAAALAHELPVVTRDAAEFRRVPGLRVVAY